MTYMMSFTSHQWMPLTRGQWWFLLYARINWWINSRVIVDFERHQSCMTSLLWQWASYQIRKIAGCACSGNAGNIFRSPVVAGKYSWYSRRMRNPQFYISSKRPVRPTFTYTFVFKHFDIHITILSVLFLVVYIDNKSYYIFIFYKLHLVYSVDYGHKPLL